MCSRAQQGAAGQGSGSRAVPWQQSAAARSRTGPRRRLARALPGYAKGLHPGHARAAHALPIGLAGGMVCGRVACRPSHCFPLACHSSQPAGIMVYGNGYFGVTEANYAVVLLHVWGYIMG